jgi:hypothetical protein
MHELIGLESHGIQRMNHTEIAFGHFDSGRKSEGDGGGLLIYGEMQECVRKGSSFVS